MKSVQGLMEADSINDLVMHLKITSIINKVTKCKIEHHNSQILWESIIHPYHELTWTMLTLNLQYFISLKSKDNS